MTAARASVAAAVLLAALAAGCGKKPEEKADAATERAQATERARKDVFGTQVQSLDKAKALGADVNRKAEEQQDAADKMSK